MLHYLKEEEEEEEEEKEEEEKEEVVFCFSTMRWRSWRSSPRSPT